MALSITLYNLLIKPTFSMTQLRATIDTQEKVKNWYQAHLITNWQTGGVAVQMKCSCEIVSLLKKYLEKVAAMERSGFWKSK